MSTIVHTHRHDEWSLLDGTGTAQQYAKYAKELGMPALTQTNHATLSGSLHHYGACKDEGIIPIMGVEAYYKPDRHQMDVEHKDCYHLVLIAKNLAGWHNLIRITTEAYASGFYHKPCVDNELLSLYGKDLICTTACVNSFLNKSILKEDESSALFFLDHLKTTFRDDLFIELMPHDFDDQRYINQVLVNISTENSIPLLATVDAHYPYKEWADTQDIMLMLSTGQTMEKRKEKRDAGEEVYTFDCDTLYLMSREDVESTFERYHPDLPKSIVTESIDNTLHLLEKVEPFLIDKKQKMPKVKGSSEKIIMDWCREGMKRIGKEGVDEYEERFEYEFGVLKKNEILDYFVIVGDVVRWCAEENIRIGAGRGSAAGCLVSYLIGITLLDPIAHGLLFERFLNPDRKGMPDIDLDFQSDRRDDVKLYLADKWGKDHVADVCSHQTYQPRAAIQKLTMVYDYPYSEARAIIEELPEKTEDSLTDLCKEIETLDKFRVDNPEIWKHALRMEGQVHTLSKHAAGVVITDKPISEYMPLMKKAKGPMITAWGDRADFPIISNYGFMKLDVLSTKGLTKQEYACDLVEKFTDNERPNMNNLSIFTDPNDVDEKVMQAFIDGLVLGVWQFSGSHGWVRMIRQIRPTWFGDLAAANAIYRPGAIKSLDQFVARKWGKEKINYFHESVEDVLKETYGLILYQEQIMKLSQIMGNFTGGEADTLRKKISKEYRLGLAHVKNTLRTEGFEEKFLQGCSDNSINNAIGNEVWKLFLAFGGYGFNKSHAGAYAAQSYQDMWLKVNFPAQFYAAQLTYDTQDAKKKERIVGQVMREARIFDVSIKPPDINKSRFGFTLDGDSIRYGLQAVKQMGDVAVNAVVDNQPFRSFDDFRERIPARQVNSLARDCLIRAGAFDSFGMREDFTPDEYNEGEQDVLGIKLTASSRVQKYKHIIDERSLRYERYNSLDEGAGVTIGGEVIRVKEITTRGGHQMGFFEVQNGLDTFSCTAFPGEWSEFCDLIAEGTPVMVRGRKNIRERGPTILVDFMCDLEELAMALAKD